VTPPAFHSAHHEDRTPTHGYEPTREAAMAGAPPAMAAVDLCEPDRAPPGPLAAAG
jgi:hypothetical protein